MKKLLVLAIAWAATFGAKASFLPYFDNIRSAIVDRQVAISNAPPISPTGKRELNTLKTALRAIDKPSTSLKLDLVTMAKVVAGINKGASNEVFSFEFRSAISNYLGVLIATNDSLVAALTNANNNPKLKEKANLLLGHAQVVLAGIAPETDLNGAAKALGLALTKYLAAAKAVAAAVNAKPVPLPAPRAGTLVVEISGQLYTFGAQFPLRNATATGLVGSGVAAGSSSALVVHVPSGGGPGTYTWGLLFSDTVGGHTISFAGGGTNAQVTTASPTVVAGTIESVAQVTIDGNAMQNVPFKCRFNGKKLSFGLP